MPKYVELRWRTPNGMGLGLQPDYHAPMILGLIDGTGSDGVLPMGVAIKGECPCKACE